MSSFQAPALTGKRKFDFSNENMPSLDVNNTTKRSRLSSHGNEPSEDEHHWIVQWRNHQTKKHKTWEGDGVLVVSKGSNASLYDSTDGKLIAAGKVELPLFDGKLFNVGGKDLELDRKITKQDYLSGICFGSNSAVFNQTAQSAPKQAPTKAFRPLTFRKPDLVGPSTGNTEKTSTISSEPLASLEVERHAYDGSNESNHPSQTHTSYLSPSFWAVNWRKVSSSIKKQITWEGDAFISCIDQKITMISEEGKIMGTTSCKSHQHRSGEHCYVGGKELLLLNEVSSSDKPFVPSDKPLLDEPKSQITDSPGPPPTSRYVPPAQFYAPVRAKKPTGPLHDPDAEDAVVLKAPTKEHMERYNKKDRPVVPVVLDPLLARRMRPHQREGVQFMYECVMDLRKHEGQGCILADEMGLGKTLQTIGLIWTLLRQNPYAGAGPIASKVLIVCPVSLINNWKAEFHKWLGRDRVGVNVCDKNANAAKTFASSPRQHVLIVGYERLRTVMKEITTCGVGLIVCDEGHRLKSAKAKTSTIFKQLNVPRRVILSGTPIQNDLGEFHSMVDFCNPGLLDEHSAFRRLYEMPILKSRAPGCTAKELELGEKRSAQLSSVAKSFVLRREATILGNYLPPKHEYVVFVTPTALQLSIFAQVLDPNKVDDFVESSSTAESLALINILTKISSSPILLKASADKERSQNNGEGGLKRSNIHDALKLLPPNGQIEDLSLSGKMIALSKLLAIIKQESEEKCVLVSHYTSTLNILESYCKKMNYSFLRLDGQTPAAKRQEYVNTFNKTNQKTSFIFLLSSKAGGTGINLIGASRLCLVDSDWNPSHDLQSQSRCHRDGQKRPVFIYRFLTAGTIDEKIYQRQITKLGLSNALMGSENSKTKSKADSFTRKELRDIFRVHPDTSSNTHDLLECSCENADVLEADLHQEDSHDISGDDSDSYNGFVTASQVNVKPHGESDVEYLQKKKVNLASLGEWKHIPCLKDDAAADIKDELLRRILYVKSKEDIMDASDLDNLKGPSARTVAGGTISFLFERSCSMTVDSIDKVEEKEDTIY